MFAIRRVVFLVSVVVLGPVGPSRAAADEPYPFPITELDPGLPDLLRSTFSKQCRPFGVRVIGTEGVPDPILRHAANVMAQYLDNDADGAVDDAAVLESMHRRRAILVMFRDERDRDRSLQNWEESDADDLFDRYHLQDLQVLETHPDGAARGRFDASLEEVLHLVNTAGHCFAYPDAFGLRKDTALSQAMDLARGGRFERPPRRYPEGAWYTYDDPTCDYECQMAEYLYWGITSLMDGQDFPGRAREIGREWRPNTPARMREMDPALTGLLTDPEYRMPTVLPDGRYRPTNSLQEFEGEDGGAAPAGSRDQDSSLAYARRLQVHGITIEATEAVPNEYLYIAALTYDHMTSRREPIDFREAMQSSGFRILLIDRDQDFSDLPEFAGDTEVDHADGLGGCIGEFFIAVKVGRPHTLVHELGHGLYHSGLQFLETGGATDEERWYEERVRAVYGQDLEAAFEEHGEALIHEVLLADEGTVSQEIAGCWRNADQNQLWAGEYASTEPNEYWAEGVAYWFRAVTLPEGVDPRAALKERDPMLHALLARLFPAADWQPSDAVVGAADSVVYHNDDDDFEGPQDVARMLNELAREDPEAARDEIESLEVQHIPPHEAAEHLEFVKEVHQQIETDWLRALVARKVAEIRSHFELDGER